jgi:hypothetical protein
LRQTQTCLVPALPQKSWQVLSNNVGLPLSSFCKFTLGVPLSTIPLDNVGLLLSTFPMDGDSLKNNFPKIVSEKVGLPLEDSLGTNVGFWDGETASPLVGAYEGVAVGLPLGESLGPGVGGIGGKVSR